MNYIQRLLRIKGKLGGYGAAGPTWVNNIVAYWKMNEASDGSGAVTRNDSVGAHHFTDNGTTASVAGIISNACNFVPADNTCLSITTVTDFVMTAPGFSTSSWVYIADKSALRSIITKWSLEFILRYDNASDRFTFGLYNTVGTPTTVTANNFGSPSINTWYHIITKYDTSTGKIYIKVNDGTWDEAAFTGTAKTTAQPLYIGALAVGGQEMQGYIDEVGYWVRPLTDAECTSLYNGGAGRTYPF